MPGEPSDLPAPGARRFWCRPTDDPDRVVFEPDEAHHLLRVMRLRRGARVDAIDGSGRVLIVEIEGGDRGRLRGRVVGVAGSEEHRDLELWLAPAIIRPARLEWLVEKAVEFGISGLIPIATRRSLPVERLAASRIERLERIARSAVAQSLGTRHPTIESPTLLTDLRFEGFDHVIVAHGPGPLRSVEGRGRVLVIVGPEGGLDDTEIAVLERRGAARISLGRRRLRSETAAIVALAMVALHADQVGGDH